MAGGGYQLLRWEPRHLPVRFVTVDGEVRRLSRARLQETVLGHLHGGILSQDLTEIKAAVEALPWVRSASLRRLWPDRLELAVEEQEPVARWGDDGLVTSDGVVFRPKDEELPRGLSRLVAADDKAPAVVDRFLAWGPRFERTRLSLVELSLDARGAWTLSFDAGFTLALGTSQVEERLSRFLRAYPLLAAAGRSELVDMRYSNGLAVRWAENQGPGAREAAKTAVLEPRPSALRSGPSRS